MFGLVNWFFDQFDCYVNTLEEFVKQIKEKDCKKIKGEYFCKPLFLFQYSIMDDFQEKFMGEGYYIRLVGCEGEKKVLYTELIKLKNEKRDEMEEEDLIPILVDKLKQVETLLSPDKIETMVVKNLDSFFEEEKIIPKEKIKSICKQKINTKKGPVE